VTGPRNIPFPTTPIFAPVWPLWLNPSCPQACLLRPWPRVYRLLRFYVQERCMLESDAEFSEHFSASSMHHRSHRGSLTNASGDPRRLCCGSAAVTAPDTAIRGIAHRDRTRHNSHPQGYLPQRYVVNPLNPQKYGLPAGSVRLSRVISGVY
jgi:hypothetical protein